MFGQTKVMLVVDKNVTLVAVRVVTQRQQLTQIGKITPTTVMELTQKLVADAHIKQPSHTMVGQKHLITM